MNDKKLLSMKIKKEKGWKRLNGEDIFKLVSSLFVVGAFTYPIALSILFGLKIALNIFLINMIFYILLALGTISILYYLISGTIFLVEKAKLISKVKKLPLTPVEVMMNFGKINGKELETNEAFNLYVEYLMALKRHEAFTTIDERLERVVLREIEKYKGEK